MASSTKIAVSSDLLKPCAGNCSGHGVCVHVLRDTGAFMPPSMGICYVGRSDCLAVCDCEDDYFGSATCDVSTDEFELRQASRGEVIGGLKTLVDLENPDPQVVGGWANSLAQSTLVSSELTDASSMAALSLVDTIIRTANDTTTEDQLLSMAAQKSLFSTVNAVIESSASQQRRRRLQNIRRGLSAEAVESKANTATVSSTLLNNLGSVVATSMLPGQNAKEFRTEQFRLSVQVLTSEAGENTTLSVPQSPLEKLMGTPSTKVMVPSSEGVSLVTTSMASGVYSNTEDSDTVQANPLTIYTSERLCEQPPCQVHIILQNSQPIDYDLLNGDGMNTTFSVDCLAGDDSVHSFTCPDGNVLSLSCNNSMGVVSQQCPVTTYASACSSLDVGADAMMDPGKSGCTVVGYSSSNITCACDFQTLSRRQLLTAENFTTAEGYSVSYVAMLQSTTKNFLSTVQTADDLDASTVTKGWRALATLGALSIGILISLFWSHNADYRMKKVNPDDGSSSPKAKKTMIPSILSNTKKLSPKTGERKRLKFNARSKNILMNAELAVVEDSLPKALSSRTFSDRFLEEVKQHHRWLGIVFYFSDAFPRVLRVTSLATNAIVMLFIQSITYNLTNPDDGSCELLHTETACLEAKSPFATGESKCAWTLSDGTSSGLQGSCTYVEPDNSIRIILFVAIFCAVVTTPIALMADWIILNVLSAPTEEIRPSVTAAVDLLAPSIETGLAASTAVVTTSSDTSTGSTGDRPSMLRRLSSSHLREYLGIFSNEEKLKEDKILLAKSQTELSMLSNKLQRYRQNLTTEQQEEFDMLWGLDGEGKFLIKAVEATTTVERMKRLCFKPQEMNVKEAVLMDLKRIHETVQKEERLLLVSNARKHEIGKKLLFLFQCDLLPGISGKILEAKSNRDSTTVKKVKYRSKVVGWTFLFLMNAGMLFYILLFALTQTGPRQNAWFQSFALWLVVEILFVSTAIVYITHILVPSLIMKDLSQIKRRLMDNIRDFNDKVQSAVKMDKSTIDAEENGFSFNAANFLFVSTRLARQFPDLKESKIIQQFSTPWPRQSYLHIQNVSKKYSKKFSAFTRSASILLIFFVGNFLSVPPACQDIILQITSTTAIGYLVLIHVQLFEIFPALVILPSLVLVVLTHFIIQSSKADAKIKLARLFPASKRSRIQPISTTLPTDQVTTDQGKDDSDSEGMYDISDESDYFEESHPVVVAQSSIPAHRTRRQSIQAGLDLIQSTMSMQHRQQESEEIECIANASEDSSLSSSSSSNSSCSSSSNSSDHSLSDVEVQLHLPATSPRVSPRVLSKRRGMCINRSRDTDTSSISVISCNDPQLKYIAEQEDEAADSQHSNRHTMIRSQDDSVSVSSANDSSNSSVSESEDSDYSTSTCGSDITEDHPHIVENVMPITHTEPLACIAANTNHSLSSRSSSSGSASESESDTEHPVNSIARTNTLEAVPYNTIAAQRVTDQSSSCSGSSQSFTTENSFVMVRPTPSSPTLLTPLAVTVPLASISATTRQCAGMESHESSTSSVVFDDSSSDSEEDNTVACVPHTKHTVHTSSIHSSSGNSDGGSSSNGSDSAEDCSSGEDHTYSSVSAESSHQHQHEDKAQPRLPSAQLSATNPSAVSEEDTYSSNLSTYQSHSDSSTSNHVDQQPTQH